MWCSNQQDVLGKKNRETAKTHRVLVFRWRCELIDDSKRVLGSRRVEGRSEEGNGEKSGNSPPFTIK